MEWSWSRFRSFTSHCKIDSLEKLNALNETFSGYVYETLMLIFAIRRLHSKCC